MTITDSQAAEIPYQWWWGLLGCAFLIGVIIIAGPYSNHITFLPDQGSSWYYWKLPVADTMARITAWGGYLLHQISLWAIIYYGIRKKPKYVMGLHRFNLLALAVNTFFILAHIAQTKLFYDGLAQDTSIYSSFGSVAIMLFLIFIMENKRRGMLFGKGKNIGVLNTVGQTLRHYHGFYFSWAIIYTFWYHPIEMTSGHLLGTFYTVMLMLQGSLFFTRFHVNRWWTVFLESFYAIHGAIVAYFVSMHGATAFMFLLGGMGAFAITQSYGLALNKGQRLAIFVLFIACLATYSIVQSEEMFRPAIVIAARYVAITLLALLLWLVFRSISWTRALARKNMDTEAPTTRES